MGGAFKYVKAKGIALEADYPYVAKKNKNCDKTPAREFKIKGHTDVK